MQSNPLERLQASLGEGYFPLTKLIIAINALTLIAYWCHAPVYELFAVVAPVHPWTFLTYPLVSLDPIGLLFYGIMLYFFCGSLERSWGSAFFARYFAAMSVISAASLWVGTAILSHSAAATIPTVAFNWLPLSALIIAWCMLNPDQLIYFWGIIPILAKWIAVGEVVIIFFTYAHGSLILGPFSLGGCLASYLWVRTRAWKDVNLYSTMPYIPKVKPQPKPRRGSRDDAFTWRNLNPLEWIARWRRKRQFMRLWKDD